MQPLRITGYTHVLAEKQEEYLNLAVEQKVQTAVVIAEENLLIGMYQGVQSLRSRWEPTPKELELLNKGGAVTLTILGNGHPPVMLSVDEPMAEKINLESDDA